MYRCFYLLAALALVGCGAGSTPLQSIVPKEFDYASIDTLVFDYQSTIAARCEGGGDCTSPTGTTPAPDLSGWGTVNLTAAPVAVSISD